MTLTGKALRAGFAAAVAGLTLASCGGDDDKTTTGSAASATTASASDDDKVRGVTRAFTVALAAGDQGNATQRESACRFLSAKAKEQVQVVGTKLGASTCEATFVAIGNLASDDQRAKTKSMTIDVKVDGDTATASYPAPLDGTPTSLALVREGSGWVIDSMPTSGSSTTAPTATAETATAPAAEAPQTIPNSTTLESGLSTGDVEVFGEPRTVSSGDPDDVLAERIPPEIMRYCKKVSDLPDIVIAGLTCEPFSKTEINYALFEDSATMNAAYGGNDEGPKVPGKAQGQDCREPGDREGSFSNKTFGIDSGRVRCWTLSDGRPRFTWITTNADSEPIIAEATEGDKVWGSLYRVWSEHAGPFASRQLGE